MTQKWDAKIAVSRFFVVETMVQVYFVSSRKNALISSLDRANYQRARK